MKRLIFYPKCSIKSALPVTNLCLATCLALALVACSGGSSLNTAAAPVTAPGLNVEAQSNYKQADGSVDTGVVQGAINNYNQSGAKQVQ